MCSLHLPRQISTHRALRPVGSENGRAPCSESGTGSARICNGRIRRVWGSLAHTTSVCLFTILGTSATTGCASGSSKSSQAPLSVSQGSAYGAEEILGFAKELVVSLEMPAEKQSVLLEKIEKIVNDPNFRPGIYQDMQKIGVTGVFSYRLGEGGAVLTVKSGRAVARIKGRAMAERYRITGADLGAQLAASREWGLGLVFGLREGEAFVGKYFGMQRSAAVVAGSGTAAMAPKRGNHKLVMVGAGSGVSLDISGSQLKIKREK